MEVEGFWSWNCCKIVSISSSKSDFCSIYATFSILSHCRTMCANCRINWPPTAASSWLSLISIFTTWTDWFLVPPRDSKSTQRHAHSPPTFTHNVKAFLFASDDDIKHRLRLHPPLRMFLDTAVPIQHGQQSIRRIQIRVFEFQFIVNVVVGDVERVDIRLARWRTRETHCGVGAERLHVELAATALNY